MHTWRHWWQSTNLSSCCPTWVVVMTRPICWLTNMSSHCLSSVVLIRSVWRLKIEQRNIVLSPLVGCSCDLFRDWPIRHCVVPFYWQHWLSARFTRQFEWILTDAISRPICLGTSISSIRRLPDVSSRCLAALLQSIWYVSDGGLESLNTLIIHSNGLVILPHVTTYDHMFSTQLLLHLVLITIIVVHW